MGSTRRLAFAAILAATPALAQQPQPAAPAAAPAPAATAPAAPAAGAPAGAKLTPDQIKAEILNGQPFTWTNSKGVSYKLTATPDGKIAREPTGPRGRKDTGAWRTTETGYCTKWSSGREGCFTVEKTAAGYDLKTDKGRAAGKIAR